MSTSPALTRQTGLALCFDGRGLSLHPGMAPPVPAPGEVLFRPSAVLVDARDRSAAGPASTFRGILGHRAVGRVDGRSDALWAPAPHVFCAVCDLCRAGLSTHCRLRRTLGLAGRDGLLAETASIPAPSARPLPRGLSPDTALFALDAARAVHIAQRSAIASRAYVSVLGDGVLALIVAQVLAQRNARVRCLGRAPGREELCERWGVKYRPADEAGRRADQDLVVVCSAGAREFEHASALVRPRGVIALAPPSGPLEPCPEALGACARLEVTLLNIDWGSLDEGLALLAEGVIDTSRLISDRRPLAGAPEAFALAGRPDALGVVVDLPEARRL